MADLSVFTKELDLKYTENTYTPEESEPRVAVFQEVVNSRRSVRVFDQTPIPDKVVRNCLELALKAPNSSNLQSTEFYWVKTISSKQKLVLACLNQPAARTAQELVVCVARTNTWKKNAQQMLNHFDSLEASGEFVPNSARQYYKSIVPLAYNQGIFGIRGLIKKMIVSVIGIFKPIPRGPSSKQEMILWAAKSASLACENLMLAFRAYGYDTCPMEGFDECRVKKMLELPRDVSVVMVISAGKRAPTGVYGPQVRFDSSQFLFEK